MKGIFPETADEIAIDRMYVDNNSLTVGDTITVGGKELKITGLVALSDYSALFSDPGDLMFDSGKIRRVRADTRGLHRLSLIPI